LTFGDLLVGRTRIWDILSLVRFKCCLSYHNSLELNIAQERRKIKNGALDACQDARQTLQVLNPEPMSLIWADDCPVQRGLR
jgi:hypothetical protein